MSPSLERYDSASWSRSTCGVRVTKDPPEEAPVAAPPSPALDAVEANPMPEKTATAKVCTHLARFLFLFSVQASPFTAWGAYGGA